MTESCRLKEIYDLRERVLLFAAPGNLEMGSEIAEKRHFRMRASDPRYGWNRNQIGFWDTPFRNGHLPLKTITGILQQVSPSQGDWLLQQRKTGSRESAESAINQ